MESFLDTLARTAADCSLDCLLIGSESVGTRGLLQSLTNGQQLQGAPTLNEGSYVLWFNETDPLFGAQISIDFVAQAVPEVSTSLLLITGGLLLLRRR